MEYMINISTYNCAEERCVGDVYHAFLDYAFSQANFFMLVLQIIMERDFQPVQNKFKRNLNRSA